MCAGLQGALGQCLWLNQIFMEQLGLLRQGLPLCDSTAQEVIRNTVAFKLINSSDDCQLKTTQHGSLKSRALHIHTYCDL